jgi:hypothetical protein
MVMRLAVVGACLIAGGLLFNASGYAKITVPLGVVALLVSGILWLIGNRNSSTRR